MVDAVKTPQDLMVSYMMAKNPDAALQYQRQQAIAQALADGSNQGDMAPNTLANPGGYVINQSPLLMAGKAIEKGMSGYLQGKNQAMLAKALGGPSAADITNQAIGVGEGPASPQQLGAVMQGNQGGYNAMAPVTGNPFRDAAYANFNSAAYDANAKAAANQYYGDRTKTNEQKNISDPSVAPYMAKDLSYEDANGVRHPYPTFQNNVKQPQASQPQQPSMSIPEIPSLSSAPPSPNGSMPAPPPTPDQQAMNTKNNAQQIPMSSDNKPIIPEASDISKYKPDPTLTPFFGNPASKTDVAQVTANQSDMAKGSTEMATFGRNLSLENSRLDNLISDYKNVQSGTITALHPETVNYLSSLGLLTKDGTGDLAGIQSAINTHILDAISQMKDTNSNVGGGAPTRLFGAEIDKLLEEGASAKDQPAALFNILTNAKGIVNHSQDLVNGWDAIGGRGNRIAGGYSMLPDDYTQKFIKSHNIQDYINTAQKTTPQFKGMEPQQAPVIKTLNGVNYQRLGPGKWIPVDKQ